MRVGYVHGFAGVSGAGMLGACSELGVGLDTLHDGWSRLHLPPLQVVSERVQLPEYPATRLIADTADMASWLARLTWAELLAHVDRGDVPERVRQRLLRVLHHAVTMALRVTGGDDQDAVCRLSWLPSVLWLGSGLVLALETLQIEHLLSAPVNLGMGPQPLITEALQHIPVYGDPTPGVQTTLDGAVLLASLAMSFGPMPAMTIAQIGYGVDAKHHAEARHGVQILLGEADGPVAADRIAVLETNIDDMNPEFYEAIFERLFGAGALDVTLSPLFMKKGRPANMLTVLAPLHAVAALSRLILQETSTFGVRISEVWRQKLERFFRPVDTRYGTIPVKCGVLDGRTVQAAPEYDACKRAAQAHGVPVRLVYSEASRLAAVWLI